MTKERRQYIMHAIGQKAKEIAPKGTEVILFGSQAREDAHSESDWDVLLLLDKERITANDIDEYTYPLWELGLDVNEKINAILYTKKDWNHNIASPFVENVTRDGIKL
jgi:predicted nucleotidyltransferase